MLELLIFFSLHSRWRKKLSRRKDLIDNSHVWYLIQGVCPIKTPNAMLYIHLYSFKIIQDINHHTQSSLHHSLSQNFQSLDQPKPLSRIVSFSSHISWYSTAEVETEPYTRMASSSTLNEVWTSSIVCQTPTSTTSCATALAPCYWHQSVDAESYESEDEKEDDDDDCYNVVFLDHDCGLCGVGRVGWLVADLRAAGGGQWG